MRFLSDFPVLRLGNPREAEGQGFSSAIWREPGDAMASVADVAGGADAVLVLGQAVIPDLAAETIQINDEFDVSKLPIGFVTRSSVTGLFIAQGAVLVPASHPGDSWPKPAVTFPYSIGDYKGHSTPEEAFSNGFRSVHDQKAATAVEQARLALAASLGQDTLNGGWWILGALSGLARESVMDAWGEHEWLLDEPNETDRQIRIEARKIRQSTGLPVRALTQGESRALKAMLPPWPGSTIWRNFQEDSRNLDPATASAISRICAAAARLWPDLERVEDLA